MEINSTSVMMRKLNNGKKSPDTKSTHSAEESAETVEQNKKVLSYTPQPKSAAEMEHVLKNSFTDAYSKDNSPMD